MKLLEFITFVACASAFLSGLGILFTALILRIGAAHALTESLIQPLVAYRTVAARIGRVMTGTSLRAVRPQIAVVFSALMVFAGITTSVVRSLTLEKLLRSSNVVLHSTYESVRDRYIPADVIEPEPTWAVAQASFPIEPLAMNLARQGEKGLINLSGSDYRSFGVLAYKEGRYDDAIRYFTAALERNPQDYRTLTSLGVTYFQKGELIANQDKKADWNMKAVEAHMKAIKLKPTFVVAYSNLGISLYYVGKEEQAISAEEKAIQLDPSYAEAYYNLASIYSLKNKKEAALERLEQAIQKGYNNLGEMTADRSLDNIRDTPRYQQLEQLVKSGREIPKDEGEGPK